MNRKAGDETLTEVIHKLILTGSPLVFPTIHTFILLVSKWALLCVVLGFCLFISLILSLL